MKKNEKTVRDVAFGEIFTRLDGLFVKNRSKKEEYPYLPVFCVKKNKRSFLVDKKPEVLSIYPNERVSCVGCLLGV